MLICIRFYTKPIQLRFYTKRILPRNKNQTKDAALIWTPLYPLFVTVNLDSKLKAHTISFVRYSYCIISSIFPVHLYHQLHYAFLIKQTTSRPKLSHHSAKTNQSTTMTSNQWWTSLIWHPFVIFLINGTNKNQWTKLNAFPPIICCCYRGTKSGYCRWHIK